MSRSIVVIENMQTLIVGGHSINLPSEIRQYYEFDSCFVVRMAYKETNESNLVGYAYSEMNFSIKWKFLNKDVIGIIPEIPETKRSDDFVSIRHYEDFINQFSGKELLIVQAGDFGYRIDASTGDIYGKWETR
jgi:hypothetical protein